jgi:lysozyme
MLHGFDVSHWQGSVDWADLKRRYGIAFGACKATEGVTIIDNQFKANWSKLAGIDVVRMPYCFGHPNRDPKTTVEFFLNTVGSLTATDLLVLDLETSDGLSQATVNAWAKAWAAHVRKLAPEHTPVLYADSAYMENKTGQGLNGPYGAWWYPRYPKAYVDTTSWPSSLTATLPSPNAWGGPPNFWQFTASFITPDHVLDANVFNGTLAQLRSLNGDTMPTAQEIATAVWDFNIKDYSGAARDASTMLQRTHTNSVLTRDGVAALLGRDPADVDEQALADALAPLLKSVDTAALLAAIQALPDETVAAIKAAL